VNSKAFHIKNVRYSIRTAKEEDANQLSQLRLQIDGETENMDRERGEAYIDEAGFKQLIQNDRELERNLFLVAAVDQRIVGFSRCEGNSLKRTAHRVEFGVCVLQDYWGYGIGTNLLKESISWADSSSIEKISLSVLETNDLSDGKYYSTIVMGRIRP